MRNVAYRRVSTESQNFHRQLVDLNVTFEKEFSDKLSGKDTNRPELTACLNYLEKGDTLWCHEISRLARDVEDLRNIVFDLMEKGVTVKFVKEGLEFTGDEQSGMKVAMSRMLLTLLGSVAEFERALINGRIVEGVEQAKKRGVKFGGSSPKHKASFKANRAKGLHKVNKSSEKATLANKPVVDTIRDIVEFSSDSLNYGQIADKLNGKGFTTTRGKSFSGVAVQRLIARNNIEYKPKNKL